VKRKPFEMFHQPVEQLPHKQSSTYSEEQRTSSSNKVVSEQHTEENPRKLPEDEGANATMLREVAQITVQSFQSSQEAMRVALEVIGHFLDCQTLFIARVDMNKHEKTNTGNYGNAAQSVLKIIETCNSNTAMSSPVAGSEGPLEDTYCQTIIQTHKPLIIEDVEHYPFYQRLATTEKYHIGSYIGVPLIYSDGRVYGTLCSQDPHPRSLLNHPENLELMQIVARFLVSYIEREELTTQVREAEQLQADLARKEQQARVEADLHVRELEAVFEAIGDGLLVSDLSGRLRMNAAARRLLFVGHPAATIDHTIEKQSEKPFILDEFDQPLATEHWPIIRVLRGEHLIGTNVANVLRGNTLEEKRYLNVSGMPIYDQQGQVNGGVCVFRDVTEHYLLERRTHDTLNALLALAESLAWLPANVSEFSEISSFPLACQRLTELIATLLQCQDVGIISLEPDTATWQLQTLYGSARVPELSYWQETMDIVRNAPALGSDMNQLRNNEVVMHSLEDQPEEDTSVLVEVPMFLGNHLIGILALIYRQHDAIVTPEECTLAKAVAKLTGLIYERERLLQEQAEARAHSLALQETNLRFNEFLSIASHELKGPLTAMKVNVQLARRTLRAQEQEASWSVLKKLQRYLERTEYQIRVQDRLASDLIDVSRIRVGKLELQKQWCDLVQIVREAVEDQRQTTEDRVINLELSADKMIICGDADRLGQVVNNYLTNALKYSSSDKPVDVIVMIDGNEARVIVSDQGPGLTQEEQERVWERFYRAKDVQVLSGHSIGLGLGLHISKTIIDEHGGQVGLYSVPEQGSQFWFTLPLSVAHSSC
jgi:signal transduction histidine kinase